MSDVAGYIAHELRTPLATQRSLLELALADPDADALTWREIAGEVLDACRRQERLLEACLALGRSRAGLDECEIVDIASLTGDLLRTIDLDGLTLRVRLEPAVTAGDHALIERLLDNLLGNAVRHNTAGGWIAVATSSHGSQARLAIENTGASIPADGLSRLFEPFQQGDRPAARPATGLGLGLGLAIVRAVADAHGAGIAARTRPGGGLRVEVTFRSRLRVTPQSDPRPPRRDLPIAPGSVRSGVDRSPCVRDGGRECFYVRQRDQGSTTAR